MPQSTAAITNVAQAFEVIKEMRLEGIEWSEDYRVHGRKALKLILEEQMKDRIDRYLEVVDRQGGADRGVPCPHRPPDPAPNMGPGGRSTTKPRFPLRYPSIFLPIAYS